MDDKAKLSLLKQSYKKLQKDKEELQMTLQTKIDAQNAQLEGESALSPHPSPPCHHS